MRYITGSRGRDLLLFLLLAILFVAGGAMRLPVYFRAPVPVVAQ